MAKIKNSLLNTIKDQIKKSGANKGKFIYFKPDQKVRIRFLQDLDEGLQILFHDSFKQSINVPCQEALGKGDCEYCEDESLRHRDQYLWSVYDYDAKEVRILMGPANSASPIPALVGMYEAYNTLVDRDYVITRAGTGTSTTYSVVPMDKVKFKNKKVKPFSESKMLELLDKAFPADSDEDTEDEDKPKGGKSKPEPEEVEDDTEELDYDEMSAKELYKLCKKRKIKVKKKQDEDYYIEKLEEWDEEQEEDDDEDW